MKQYNHDKFQETYYEEVLENGLRVVIWQKADFANSQFIFATPYGALDYLQITSNGELKMFPSGIAHFLEHKMFEMPDGDVMEQFSNLGANVNAFTSYNETMYYFSSTKKELSTEINLLLDFVQDLQITPESVEKEKGIIIQELSMYLQMPESRLIFETFKSLYHNHPLHMDIGGNTETVSNTTYADLMSCHQLNYHPSKMIFFAATALDPQVIIDIVKNNQASKNFETFLPVERFCEEEPKEVKRTLWSLPMDISNEKTSISYKLNSLFSDVKERSKVEWCLRFLLESHFSTLNPQYQTWLDQDLINDFFGYEIDLGVDYGFLIFYGEAQNVKFTDFIRSEINNLKNNIVSASKIEQIKRRLFGSSMRVFNGTENIGFTFIRNYFNGLDIFEALEIIDEITVDEVINAYENLDFSAESITIITPEN